MMMRMKQKQRSSSSKARGCGTAGMASMGHDKPLQQLLQPPLQQQQGLVDSATVNFRKRCGILLLA
jgi:hypothetical protein